MLTIPERIAQVAEHIARHNSHGYSQNNRAGDGTTESVTLSDGSKVVIHGGDYDCSEMVRVCVNCALSGNYRSPIEFMWTGNESAQLTAHGFVRIPYGASKVRRGDVLWVSGHTGVALGGGMQADAHGDEYGGITGPNRGDQTGHEVEVRSLRSWTYIYRYEGGESEGEWSEVTETVTFKKKSRVHVEPKVKSAYTYTYQPGESVILDGLLISEGYVWGTYIGSKGARRYVIVGSAGRLAR